MLSVGVLRRCLLGLGVTRTNGWRDLWYEPWFRDGEVNFYAHILAQSRPCTNEIHEKLAKLGYIVHDFGEYGGEVIVHYRRGGDKVLVDRSYALR
ncbi:MAG: hypothetical protein ACTSXC_07575 [Candidatus Freyarchaeota archaeon]